MAITYTNFLTQVRNYTEVDSNVLSDTLIDQFIRNTELDIAGKVDYDDLRKYATSNFTAGNRYVSLPGDLLIIRSVQVIDGSTRVFLEKRDTSFISEFNPTDAQGTPKYYELSNAIEHCARDRACGGVNYDSTTGHYTLMPLHAKLEKRPHFTAFIKKDHDKHHPHHPKHTHKRHTHPTTGQDYLPVTGIGSPMNPNTLPRPFNSLYAIY